MAGARENVLAFALSLPETAEDRPWEDDVVVKVRGKIFVFAGPVGSKRMSVKLAESHAHALAIDGAEPTGYGLGKAGWVCPQAPRGEAAQAARARRSSTVDPSSVSCRSNSPAHKDERSGAASRLAAVESPSSARTSTASSR